MMAEMCQAKGQAAFKRMATNILNFTGPITTGPDLYQQEGRHCMQQSKTQGKWRLKEGVRACRCCTSLVRGGAQDLGQG
eukprot:1156318-Pelagomonas_calceolata.AAC.13